MWKEALHFATSLETSNSFLWKVAVISTIITNVRLLGRGQGLLERKRVILEREGEAY
jgi:hypothetical protein